MSAFEDEMEEVLFVFSNCNALMWMLAGMSMPDAMVACRKMGRYGLCALGRRRTL